MNTECTDLFTRYREVARHVWNIGFWPNPALREWDSVELYQEAAARLFEAMIILPLGYQARIDDKYNPGLTVDFSVEPATPEVDLLVNGNSEDEPGRIWGRPKIRIKPKEQRLRFVSFFDWDQTAARDFQYLEVRIEQFDGRSEVVGRRALIPFDRCSIWFSPEEHDPRSDGE